MSQYKYKFRISKLKIKIIIIKTLTLNTVHKQHPIDKSQLKTNTAIFYTSRFKIGTHDGHGRSALVPTHNWPAVAAVGRTDLCEAIFDKYTHTHWTIVRLYCFPFRRIIYYSTL